MLDMDEKLHQTEPDSISGSGKTDFILRTPTASDIHALVAMANDPVLMKNLCAGWLPNTEKKAAMWLEAVANDTEPKSYPFILSNMKGHMLGAACIMIVEADKMAEVSVVIHRAHWHAGPCDPCASGPGGFHFLEPEYQSATSPILDRPLPCFLRHFPACRREMRLSI